MSYANRIEKLESALLPEHTAKACVLFNVADEDVDAAVARWRVKHDWPADGRHPIALLLVRWASMGGCAS